MGQRRRIRRRGARASAYARSRPAPLQIDTVEHEDGWKTLRVDFGPEMPNPGQAQEFWFDCAKIILRDISDCRMGADFLTKHGERTVRASDVCDFAGEMGQSNILRIGKNQRGHFEMRLTYRKHEVRIHASSVFRTFSGN